MRHGALVNGCWPRAVGTRQSQEKSSHGAHGVHEGHKGMKKGFSQRRIELSVRDAGGRAQFASIAPLFASLRDEIWN